MSKVIQLRSYCPDTDAHTGPTALPGPPKWAVMSCAKFALCELDLTYYRPNNSLCYVGTNSTVSSLVSKCSSTCPEEEVEDEDGVLDTAMTAVQCHAGQSATLVTSAAAVAVAG